MSIFDMLIFSMSIFSMSIFSMSVFLYADIFKNVLRAAKVVKNSCNTYIIMILSLY